MKLQCQQTPNKLIVAKFNNSFEFIINSTEGTLCVDLSLEQVKELQKKLNNDLGVEVK